MESIMDNFRPVDLAVLGIIIALFVVTWLILWEAIKKQRLRADSSKSGGTNQTIKLRLQAYERLVLLVERIKPSNLLGRLQTSGVDAQGLHAEMVQTIRNEFDHNLTQQLYVSGQSWQMVHRLVEQTIAIINNEAGKLSLNAKGTDLAKNTIERISALNDDPYQLVVAVLREETKNLLDK